MAHNSNLWEGKEVMLDRCSDWIVLLQNIPSENESLPTDDNLLL